MWLYVSRIAGPYQAAESQRIGMPHGHVSDMFGPWAGARAMLFDHRNPYGVEITEAIQRNTYGRPLDSSNPNDPRDQQRLVYPMPMMLLMAPAAVFDFEVLRPIIDAALVLLTLASVPLWIIALGIRTSRWNICIAVILTLGCWPIVQALQLQQPALIVSFLLALGAALISRGKFIAGGIVVALSIAKPQVAAPVIGWFALWSLLDWRLRWRLLASMATTLSLLLVTSELLLPHWWRYWWKNVRAAKDYVQVDAIFTTLFGPRAGPVLTLALLAAFIVLFVRLGRHHAGSPAFALGLAAAPLGGLLVSPQWLSYSQAALLPTVLWIWFSSRTSNEVWTTRTARLIAALSIAWPWFGSWILLIAAMSRHRALVVAAARHGYDRSSGRGRSIRSAGQKRDSGLECPAPCIFSIQQCRLSQ
jgi:hypothetical protein